MREVQWELEAKVTCRGLVTLSSEQSVVFCRSLPSSIGEMFLWLIKAFSFTTEHTEGTC